MSKFNLNLNLGGVGLWWNKKTCQHPLEHQDFVRNIYGDEIYHSGGMRSLWKCRDCGKDLYRSEPFVVKA